MTVARMGQIFTDYESTDFESLLLYGFDGCQVAAVLRAHIQKHHIDGINNYFFQVLKDIIHPYWTPRNHLSTALMLKYRF